MSEKSSSKYDQSDQLVNDDPRLMITSDVLKIALKNDFGPSASLSNFKVVDFTKPGDNYACVVTSVVCEVRIGGKSRKVSYIAKLNPRYNLDGFKDCSTAMFGSEGQFLVDVAPRLNAILQNIGESKLRFPVCLYASYEQDNEMLISQDLREKQFKMTDRSKGMDLNHSTLTLEELARLHASGVILKTKLKRAKGKTLAEEFPFTKNGIFTIDHSSSDSLEPFITTSFDSAIDLLEDMDGYEEASRWLKDFKEDALTIYSRHIVSVTEKFETLCHGDAWNNNILFRYNTKGIPVEVALVDLQICRTASLSIDLNYFLYSSLNGDVRRDHLQKLLSSYYQKFKSVIEKEGSIDVPFTFDELVKEYEEKKIFGFITGIFLVPMLMCPTEECFTMSEITDDGFDEFMADRRKQNLEQMKKDPLCKVRYLAIFDELIENLNR